MKQQRTSKPKEETTTLSCLQCRHQGTECFQELQIRAFSNGNQVEVSLSRGKFLYPFNINTDVLPYLDIETSNRNGQKKSG